MDAEEYSKKHCFEQDSCSECMDSKCPFNKIEYNMKKNIWVFIINTVITILNALLTYLTH